MKMLGCFVVWGEGVEPQVHTLTKGQMEIMYKREELANMATALEHAFGPGISARVPAWVDGAMEFIALNYEGPHQERVRGLCAAILTGTPYGGPEPGQRPQGGSGDRMPKQPKSPRGPRGVRIGGQVVDFANAVSP